MTSMRFPRRLAAVLPALLLLPLPARPQDRSLFWDELAVEARLDAEGTLHVRERQTMVFTGDWNGGERSFNLGLGHRLELVGLSRLDPATGREVPLVEDDSLAAVDQYAWANGSTLRWRSRLPSDPPFDRTAITYVVDYTLTYALQARGDAYRLFHDFAFPERQGVIERFVLDLELDPAWQPASQLPSHLERRRLLPGESMELAAELRFQGDGRPRVIREASAAFRYAAFAAALVAMAVLWVGLRRREKGLGRYLPPEAPSEWDEGWLAEHLFALRPEEAGALWDRRVGPAEVAAVLARLVAEGKLASEVRTRHGLFVERDVLHLRLVADRAAFLSYERQLIDKLFFDGRRETDTETVRKHYRTAGFNPAALIEDDLNRRLAKRPELRGKTASPGFRRTLSLLLAALTLFGLGAIPQWGRALATFVAAVFCLVWFYVPGLIRASSWRDATARLDLRALAFLLPGLGAFGISAAIAFFNDWFTPLRLFTGTPGPLTALALAVLPVAIWSSLLNNARSRDKPEAIRLRKRLAAARRLLGRELDSPAPRLRDEWLPYLLAFGLGSDVDRWFRAFGGGGGRAVSTASTTSTWGTSSSVGGGWTGGGGAFGGAGATASWAAAATGLAAGVSSSSSSGGGGGGGGSSGGGGGGGW